MSTPPPARIESHARALGLILIFIGLTPSVSVAEDHPSPEAYGHLANLENVILSPDGTKIAFVNTSGDERNLLVLRVGETRAFSGAHVGNAKIREVQWMDDDNLLITTSTTSLPPFGFTGAKREWSQLVTYNLTSHKLAGLSFDVPDQRTLNVLSGDPAVRIVDGKTMLYVPGLYMRDQTLPALFKFSVDGRAKLVTMAYDPWTDWLVDESGRIAVQFVYRDEKKSWEIKSRKMQTDLSDGVRYLAHQGIIDPKRVCIVGASYGGYAALAGATLDARVYRCAVSVAGVSDLKRFLKWTDDKMGNGDNLSQRYWDRFVGVSSPNDALFNAISPIGHVDAVTCPILLIHGRDDTVVPFEQSDIMADALKHAGKSVELIALKHEDHWLSRSATRQQMLDATVAFLQKNNPAD